MFGEKLEKYKCGEEGRLEKFKKEYEEMHFIDPKSFKEDEFYKEFFEVLEKLTKENKFSKINIKKEDSDIGVNEYFFYDYEDEKSKKSKLNVYFYDRNEIFVGENCLVNLNELFKIDKDFTIIGLEEIIKHERCHFYKISGKHLERGKLIAEEIIEKNEGNDDIESVRNEIKEELKKRYLEEERQTEIQRINNKFQNTEEFIRKNAVKLLTVLVAKNGFDYLREKSYKSFKLTSPGGSFINSEVAEKITSKIEEMAEDLINKEKSTI